MGRRKRAKVLKQQADWAAKLEAAEPQLGQNSGTTVASRPMLEVLYCPMFAGDPTELELLLASAAAVDFYGGADKLVLLPGNVNPIPTGFKKSVKVSHMHPSMVHTTIRLKTGTRAAGKITGRPYIRYQPGKPWTPSGRKQASWSAPLSSLDSAATPTVAAAGTAKALLANYDAVKKIVTDKAATDQGFLMRLTPESELETYDVPPKKA